jgi:phosphoglycolate phosphatase
MIGDREFDVTAAARNGIPTVGVTWGYGSREELETAGAKTLCDAPGNLASIVLALMCGATGSDPPASSP